jgi:hypothetical protein
MKGASFFIIALAIRCIPSIAQVALQDSVLVTDWPLNDSISVKTTLIRSDHIIINEGFYADGSKAFYNTSINGENIGIALSWYRNGNLRFSKTFQCDIEVGRNFEWYESGRIKMIKDCGFPNSKCSLELKADTFHILSNHIINAYSDSIVFYKKKFSGEIIYFYEKGNIERIEHYINDAKDGNFFFYDINGALIETKKYLKGNLIVE